MPLRSGAALVASVLALGVFAPTLGAQSPSSSPGFEVASVKPNVGGPQSGMTQFRGGRYITRYATLKDLIRYAYPSGGRALADRQIIAAPSWLSVERFDIEATAPGIPDDSRGLIPNAVELRIRSLLEDRCALLTHVEQRELPVYSLVLARSDGSLGPHLRRRTTSCIPATGFNQLVLGKHETCGGRAAPGTLFGNAGTINQILTGLALFVPEVDRVIVNRTGLIGSFDFELTWTPDRPDGNQPPLGAAPSLFTALEEQLGLKLEASHAAVDVLVIDHIERPTEN